MTLCSDQADNILIQLESLMQEVKSHWDLNYKAQENLSKRISKIEAGDSFDYDERIDSLENICAEKRLIQLESANLAQALDPKVWFEVNKRLDALETELSVVRALGARVYKVHPREKKPYKCPVCEGEGVNKNKLIMEGIKEPSTINMKNPDCHSCEGKGVLWG